MAVLGLLAAGATRGAALAPTPQQAEELVFAIEDAIAAVLPFVFKLLEPLPQAGKILWW